MLLLDRVKATVLSQRFDMPIPIPMCVSCGVIPFIDDRVDRTFMHSSSTERSFRGHFYSLYLGFLHDSVNNLLMRLSVCSSL